MTQSLPNLMDGLQRLLESLLSVANDAHGHPVTKGDASEKAWLGLLQNYLPKRYEAKKASG